MAEVSAETKGYISSVLNKVALDENGNRRRGLLVGSDESGLYCIDFGHGTTYRQQLRDDGTPVEASLTCDVEGGVRRVWNLIELDDGRIITSRRDYGDNYGNVKDKDGKDVVVQGEDIISNPDEAYRELARRLLDQVVNIGNRPETPPSVVFDPLDPNADLARVG